MNDETVCQREDYVKAVSGPVTPADACSSTTASYDLLVDDYERRTAQVNREYRSFRQAFIDAVDARGTVADLGCGPGRDAREFATSGLSVIGLDASQNMASRARRNGVRVVVGDVRRLPFRASAFDGIWSSASLLHIPREQVANTLRGSWYRLQPSGVLGLSTSVGDGEGWEDVPYEPASQPTRVPLRRWFVHHESDALLELVASAGFDIIQCDERHAHRRWLQVLARRAE